MAPADYIYSSVALTDQKETQKIHIKICLLFMFIILLVVFRSFGIFTISASFNSQIKSEIHTQFSRDRFRNVRLTKTTNRERKKTIEFRSHIFFRRKILYCTCTIGGTCAMRVFFNEFRFSFPFVSPSSSWFWTFLEVKTHHNKSVQF